MRHAKGKYGTIWNMDTLDYLENCRPVRAMFADPPDNLGLPYGTYVDKMEPSGYYSWIEGLVSRMMRKSKICWLSFYHTHMLEIFARVRWLLRYGGFGNWKWRLILWRFTFGQYRANDMTNDFRPILLLTQEGTQLLFENVPVISERMLLGDPRAAGFRSVDDVWEFPRVTGNAEERQTWHPTQHPEALIKRIILLSGFDFVDLFGGSGTSLRVAKSLGRSVDVVELDTFYCQQMEKFLN